MAIKIKQYNKDLAKRLKRQTLPRGTFFSEPTTMSVGGLGEGGSGLPPTPQILTMTPGYINEKQYRQPVSAWDAWFPKPQYAEITPGSADWKVRNIVNAIQRGIGVAVGANRAITRNISGSPDDRDRRVPPPLDLTKYRPPSSASVNSFVGQSLNDYPANISKETANQLFSGMPFAQQQAVMQSKGYSWVPYNGGFWSKTSDVSPMPERQATTTDARGRPEYVDPTLLERGERVTAASGATFVGGTPTESGQAQYAVTIPGQGDRWKYNIRQDNDGNWVRVYYQTYGKAKTKRGRKLRAQRAEREQGAAVQAAQPSPSVVPPVATNQLVNFRVTYG